MSTNSSTTNKLATAFYDRAAALDKALTPDKGKTGMELYELGAHVVAYLMPILDVSRHAATLALLDAGNAQHLAARVAVGLAGPIRFRASTIDSVSRSIEQEGWGRRRIRTLVGHDKARTAPGRICRVVASDKITDDGVKAVCAREDFAHLTPDAVRAVAAGKGDTVEDGKVKKAKTAPAPAPAPATVPESETAKLPPGAQEVLDYMMATGIDGSAAEIVSRLAAHFLAPKTRRGKKAGVVALTPKSAPAVVETAEELLAQVG